MGIWETLENWKEIRDYGNVADKTYLRNSMLVAFKVI